MFGVSSVVTHETSFNTLKKQLRSTLSSYRVCKFYIVHPLDNVFYKV